MPEGKIALHDQGPTYLEIPGLTGGKLMCHLAAHDLSCWNINRVIPMTCSKELCKEFHPLKVYKLVLPPSRF